MHTALLILGPAVFQVAKQAVTNRLFIALFFSHSVLSFNYWEKNHGCYSIITVFHVCHLVLLNEMAVPEK